jgi:hypothetical protein
MVGSSINTRAIVSLALLGWGEGEEEPGRCSEEVADLLAAGALWIGIPQP